MSCQEKFCMAASASLEPAATAALLNFKNNSRLFSSLKDPETTNVIAEREGSQRGLTHEPNFRGKLFGRRSTASVGGEKNGSRSKRWKSDNGGRSNRADSIPPLIHVHLQTIKAGCRELCCRGGVSGSVRGRLRCTLDNGFCVLHWGSSRPHVPAFLSNGNINTRS